mmetsp:Transcript_31161/g.98956  ORF Transcript_31161/g.98956 Transcript_31161/m.98956 type:complete len:212 (-) Transcript_31161:1469-2104(-)
MMARARRPWWAFARARGTLILLKRSANIWKDHHRRPRASSGCNMETRTHLRARNLIVSPPPMKIQCLVSCVCLAASARQKGKKKTMRNPPAAHGKVCQKFAPACTAQRRPHSALSAPCNRRRHPLLGPLSALPPPRYRAGPTPRFRLSSLVSTSILLPTLERTRRVVSASRRTNTTTSAVGARPPGHEPLPPLIHSSQERRMCAPSAHLSP